MFEEQTTVQNPLKNFRSFANSATRSVACGVFQIYGLKIYTILSNVEPVQSVNQYAGWYPILTAAGSNLRSGIFLCFYQIIFFCSFIIIVFELVWRTNYSSESIEKLKKLREFYNTKHSMQYIFKNYHIHASSVGGRHKYMRWRVLKKASGLTYMDRFNIFTFEWRILHLWPAKLKRAGTLTFWLKNKYKTNEDAFHVGCSVRQVIAHA